MQLTLRVYDASLAAFRPLDAAAQTIFSDPLQARGNARVLSRSIAGPLYLFIDDRAAPVAVYLLGHEFVRTQYLGLHNAEMDVVATAMWQRVSHAAASSVYRAFPDARLIEMDDGDCNVFLTGDCLEHMPTEAKPDDLDPQDWDDFLAVVTQALAQGAGQLVIYG